MRSNKFIIRRQMFKKREKFIWFSVLVLFCVFLGVTGCDGSGGGDKVVEPDPTDENGPGADPPG